MRDEPSARKGLSEKYNVITLTQPYSTCSRANTGAGEIGYVACLSRQLIAESDVGFHGGHNQKRAHFSSTESLDHGK